MIQNGNHLTAETGKVLRRIADGFVYGKEITLGLTYYIGGILQEPPHTDIPEDFEEIDDESEISAREALAIITGENEETSRISLPGIH